MANRYRITVELDRQTYETYSAYADAIGMTRSKTIAQMVEQAEPPIRRITALLQAAQEAPRETLANMSASLTAMADELERAAWVAADFPCPGQSHDHGKDGDR